MDPLEKHGAWSGAKFHSFYEDISMLSMLAWDRKIVRIFPMKVWGAWDKNHGKAWEFTKMKAWEAGYFLVYYF